MLGETPEERDARLAAMSDEELSDYMRGLPTDELIGAIAVAVAVAVAAGPIPADVFDDEQKEAIDNLARLKHFAAVALNLRVPKES